MIFLDEYFGDGLSWYFDVNLDILTIDFVYEYLGKELYFMVYIVCLL